MRYFTVCAQIQSHFHFLVAVAALLRRLLDGFLHGSLWCHTSVHTHARVDVDRVGLGPTAGDRRSVEVLRMMHISNTQSHSAIMFSMIA
jgi:hypothetical protein